MLVNVAEYVILQMNI